MGRAWTATSVSIVRRTAAPKIALVMANTTTLAYALVLLALVGWTVRARHAPAPVPATARVTSTGHITSACVRRAGPGLHVTSSTRRYQLSSVGVMTMVSGRALRPRLKKSPHVVFTPSPAREAASHLLIQLGKW